MLPEGRDLKGESVKKSVRGSCGKVMRVASGAESNPSSAASKKMKTPCFKYKELNSSKNLNMVGSGFFLICASR